MYIEERHERIINTLQSTGRIDVKKLADTFHVSRETIRRDLNILSENGLLLRTHGGAVLSGQESAPSSASEAPVSVRTVQNIPAKEKICSYAAKFIKDGDTIFVDNSTTCIYLYKNLPPEMQVTIITNSISFLAECAKAVNPNHTVVCLGGILKSSNLSFYGNITMKNARQYYPNKAFISCTGIASKSRITDSGVQEIDIKRFLVEASKEVFLLADPRKFQPIGQIFLCEYADIDYLITTNEADYAYLGLSDSESSKIHIAP